MNNYVSQIYDEINDIWGMPQKFKDIEFYPLKLVDTKLRKSFHMLFAYPKNYIPDKTILKMSYLKYILYVVQSAINPEGSELQGQLIEFLKHITKKEVSISWNIGDQPKDLESIVLTIKIDDVLFTEGDFENLREIILQQNGLSIEYVEQYNPEMEEKLIANSKSETTFEEEIFTFCALTKMSVYDVKDYTVYQFRNHMERLALLHEYEIYKPLEASGQIKLKDGGEIRHYFSHVKKFGGRYDSILIGKEEFQGTSDLFK